MWKYIFSAIGVLLFHPCIKFVVKCSEISDEQPLLLTPYIESEKNKEARSLALVTGLTPNITSYSGFLTINKECDSNLFFWFFPSQNNWEEDPVTLWLNGGPGVPSLYGLFYENGPYSLTLNQTLILNEYSWNLNSSMIYIDNPVGTGFSFSGKECYVENQEQIGQGILNALLQFFKLFPEVSRNPFFLTGQSYAGKYIPATAHAILNSDQKNSINFQGVAIGNGWIDPVSQLGFGDYLYHIGLIDQNIKRKMVSNEENIVKSLGLKRYWMAAYIYGQNIQLFKKVSGFEFLYNYLFEKDDSGPDMDLFLNDDEVRTAIHVGNQTFHNDSIIVKRHLFYDEMQSVKAWLEEILENGYRVLLFNGQLDIIIPYPTILNFIQKLNWKGADDYKKAGRSIWYVEDEIAGYSKTAGNFTELLVRNAGHLVPTDQPKWALDMFNRFIFNQPFDSK